MLFRQARHALLAQAETVFDEMKRAGFKPDKYTLNAMVLAYTNARQVEKVCVPVSSTRRVHDKCAVYTGFSERSHLCH